MAIHILMRSIEDANNTSILTLNRTDVVPAVLQLAVAKKEGLIPARNDKGQIMTVEQAVESDGRPAGYKRASAFLHLR